MLSFSMLPKLKPGDTVAVLSPSFAAPGRWPHIYDLGVRRLREAFGLEAAAFPATAKLGASAEERAADLIAAFEDPEIKAVITSLGGDDQVTYVRRLPDAPFRDNPKPFFGYSDNTHFQNHLWLNGVPSFYGGALFTQFAQTPQLEEFTVEYLRRALFGVGEVALTAAPSYNDVGVGWDDPANARRPRLYEPNDGWFWDGDGDASGFTWGGCLESVDEMLRHGVRLPTLEQFAQVVLMLETSEEIPEHEYVRRVLRALGERGILERVRAVLVGRPKAWEFGKPRTAEEKAAYRQGQRETVRTTVRAYNAACPVVQNLDFGHTNPQICLPYGSLVTVGGAGKSITAQF